MAFGIDPGVLKEGFGRFGMANEAVSVATVDRVFGILSGTGHTVCNIMLNTGRVGDDERWVRVGLCFAESFEGLELAGAHGSSWSLRSPMMWRASAWEA